MEQQESTALADEHELLVLTPTLIALLQDIARMLSGSERRMFMAKTVRGLGKGGQRRAEQELGWDRGTIRKGEDELTHGLLQDQYAARGRKKAEVPLPNLQEDIRDLVEPTSQTDPTFRTTRQYRRVTANRIRDQLITEKGYAPDALPQERTLRTKLDDLGFYPKKVAKSTSQKKIPETDAIFHRLHIVNHLVDRLDGYLRLSLDAKATIRLGPYSRGGYNRRPTAAVDHDFAPEATLSLFGCLLPASDETWFFFTPGPITGDVIVDRLEELWPELQARFQSHTLVLTLDNGPENQSHRTRFLKRLVELVRSHEVFLQLAYYPPYHSTYNPIQRVWGILEESWNGELLDTQDKVIHLAQDMTWKGHDPVVKMIPQVSPTGVRLTKKTMRQYERSILRMPGLARWCVWIPPTWSQRTRYGPL